MLCHLCCSSNMQKVAICSQKSLNNLYQSYGQHHWILDVSQSSEGWMCFIFCYRWSQSSSNEDDYLHVRTSCACSEPANLTVTKNPGHCSYILQARILPFPLSLPPFSRSYLPGKWSSITCRGAEGGTGDFAMQMPGNYPKARRVEAHRWK